MHQNVMQQLKRWKSIAEAKHKKGEQLLTAGVLQDDPNSDITTSWMINQVHIVHDQTHIETRHGGCLPLECVLLDNQSTIDVFVNRHLL